VVICKIRNDIYVAKARSPDETIDATRELYGVDTEILKVIYDTGGDDDFHCTYSDMRNKLRTCTDIEDIYEAGSLMKDMSNKRIEDIRKSDLSPLEKIEAWIDEQEKLWRRKCPYTHYRMFRIKDM